MSMMQHAIRMMLLMAASTVLLTWDLRHNEATSPDGLRSVRQAEQIDRGEWRQGMVGAIDHPLHPLGIVAVHGLVGGTGPVSWQRAAVALGCGCVLLLVIPAYLLTREIFGDGTAWLGGLLACAHPLLGQVAANALSESSFVLVWTFGLWAAVRFLREGRFVWLGLVVVLGGLAYLCRPEGLLLPLALTASLMLLPLHPATQIHWPRWRMAVSFLVLGSMLVACPYMMLEGKVGTRPAIARVLGLEPGADPEAVERELPVSPDQSTTETYRLAVARLGEVLVGVVPLPLLILSGIGLASIPAGPSRSRTRLFLGVLLIGSSLGLVRLHATVGYATARHALIPGILLLLASAHGLMTLAGRIRLPAEWSGASRLSYRPGPAMWCLVLAAIIITPRLGRTVQSTPGPFNVYRDTAHWLGARTNPREQVLDMTDWSLYLSGKPGLGFAQFQEASGDRELRWVIARESHLNSHRAYAPVLRGLIGDRQPVVRIPAQPEPGQLQVLVYDRWSPEGSNSEPRELAVNAPSGEGTTRR